MDGLIELSELFIKLLKVVLLFEYKKLKDSSILMVIQ